MARVPITLKYTGALLSAVLVLGGVALRLNQVQTDLVPLPEWRIAVSRSSFAGCGPCGAHIEPERLSVAFGPLHLWFPPSPEEQRKADQNNRAVDACNEARLRGKPTP